jgi:hypothetical protein
MYLIIDADFNILFECETMSGAIAQLPYTAIQYPDLGWMRVIESPRTIEVYSRVSA